MESNVFVGVKFGSSVSVIPNDNNNESGGASKLPNNYDYILVPITNGRYKDSVKAQFQSFRNEQQKQGNLADELVLEISEPELQDLCIPPFNVSEKNDTPSYIGLLSSWLELESHNVFVREMCYQVLLNECKYARFVGIRKLILAPPRELSDLQMYSQVISRLLNNDVISESPPLLLSISLPLYEDSDPLATWELWHTVRKLCGYHPSLSISLAVPRIKTPSHVLNRWLCEPVSCLLISSSIFATNQYNYPVLHKFNQYLITKFQRINGNSQPNNNSDLCIILHGMEKYSNRIKGGESAYLEYVNYLLKKGDKLLAVKQPHNSINFNSNVSPSLQQNYDSHTPRLMPPLKPHSECLTNYVYSTFERDVVKYDLYQSAIKKALLDIVTYSGLQPLSILVAGAGRGPLIDRTIRVLKQLKLLDNVSIIALEKNKQACLYLQKRNFDFWNSRVKIIKEDMRQWKDETVKVDLCISELLGSFGCNELSPECLYVVEKYHSKPNTIFIPQSYTSYAAPIASPLLHQKLTNIENGKESLWVMHNVPFCILSSKINEIWTFEHPILKGTQEAPIFFRNSVTEFKVKYRGEIHGLIGFFTARLYDDIELSTLPDDSIVKLPQESFSNVEKLEHLKISSSSRTFPNHLDSNRDILSEKFKRVNHTANLQSWSPLVFPLKEPFSVTDDTELSVFLSRIHSNSKDSAWYEWSVESFVYLVLSGTPVQKMSNPIQPTQTADSSHKSNLLPMSSHKKQGRILSEGDGAPFSNSLSDNAFLPSQESGWQSVNDIHGLSNGSDNTARPMFDLAVDEAEEEEEVHVRVKTGVSALHNINGNSFSIPL